MVDVYGEHMFSKILDSGLMPCADLNTYFG